MPKKNTDEVEWVDNDAPPSSGRTIFLFLDLVRVRVIIIIEKGHVHIYTEE